MDLKYIVAFLALLAALPTVTGAMLWSRRLRDVGFFLIVFCAPLTDKIDIHFFSREWYKGSTTGLEISLLDVIAFGILAALLVRPMKGRRFYWPAGLLPMLLYLGYAAISVMVSDPKLFGFFELTKLIRGILMFMTAALYIRSERELRVLMWAVVCIVWYEGLVALKYRYLGGIWRVSATFPHPNSLSMFMCMLAPVLYTMTVARVSTALRLMALGACCLAAVGVILTVSRTGLATLCLLMLCSVAACFSFKLNFRNLIITFGILCAMALGIAHAWPTLMQRFGAASMADEYGTESAMNRGSYLRLAGMIYGDHFFGVGLNNWSYYVSGIYGPRYGLPYKPYIGTDYPPDQTVTSEMVDTAGQSLDGAQAAPAHNLGALTLGELGLPGLVLFAFVWVRWLSVGVTFLWKRTPDPARRIGLGIFFGTCAALLQSWTEWEFRQTALFFLFSLMVGSVAALHRMRKVDRQNARREQELERQARVSSRAEGHASA